jgi:hypothetical protein
MGKVRIANLRGLLHNRAGVRGLEHAGYAQSDFKRATTSRITMQNLRGLEHCRESDI